MLIRQFLLLRLKKPTFINREDEQGFVCSKAQSMNTPKRSRRLEDFESRRIFGSRRQNPEGEVRGFLRYLLRGWGLLGCRLAGGAEPGGMRLLSLLLEHLVLLVEPCDRSSRPVLAICGTSQKTPVVATPGTTNLCHQRPPSTSNHPDDEGPVRHEGSPPPTKHPQLRPGVPAAHGGDQNHPGTQKYPPGGVGGRAGTHAWCPPEPPRCQPVRQRR